MKRKLTESFEDYKKRRKESNDSIDRRIKNGIKLILSSEWKRRHEKPEQKKERVISKVNKRVKIGKRYLNETLMDFRERRKKTNKRKREVLV